jgi:hypothetical protein
MVSQRHVHPDSHHGEGEHDMATAILGQLEAISEFAERDTFSAADYLVLRNAAKDACSMDLLSLQQLAIVLGGEVSGDQVLAPGPGHSPKDRSMCVRLVGDDYIAHSFSGDDWNAQRSYRREDRRRVRTSYPLAQVPRPSLFWTALRLS